MKPFVNHQYRFLTILLRDDFSILLSGMQTKEAGSVLCMDHILSASMLNCQKWYKNIFSTYIVYISICKSEIYKICKIKKKSYPKELFTISFWNKEHTTLIITRQWKETIRIFWHWSCLDLKWFEVSPNRRTSFPGRNRVVTFLF